MTPDEDQFRKIRATTITAIFSDQLLMNRLVLKGGNLLDLVYDISPRSSLDLDFSMEGEFSREEIGGIQIRISKSLTKAFRPQGLRVFDYKFYEKPKNSSKPRRECWGGYCVEFKLISHEKLAELGNAQDGLRRNATVTGPHQRRTFKVDISKHEFCANKEKRELEGLTIFCYPPATAVFEKLRAICQQDPEYCQLMRSHARTARARDFVDIYSICQAFKIDWRSQDHRQVLRKVFSAKSVPLEYLGKLEESREFHRQDFASVVSTVRAGYELKDFDYYSDYVLSRCAELKATGII